MTLITSVFFAPLFSFAGDPPESGGAGSDTATAVVMYGEDRLLDDVTSMNEERLAEVLDSLYELEPTPTGLIRELLLYKRVRTLDDAEMVLLIDSLFGLDTIPYALINEINLHASEMPRLEEVEHGLPISWAMTSIRPCSELYGAWSVTDPLAYGPTLSAHDSLLLVRLIRPEQECGFQMPVTGVITSRFGWRDGRNHNGVDIDLEVWDPVHAAFPGVVRFAGVYGGFGRLVVVRHYNGLETFYAHLHRFKVKPGDVVDAGDVVGLGGSSGHSTGSHLHFEVRFKGIPIDPARLIDLQDNDLYTEVIVLKRIRGGFTAFPQGTRTHRVEAGDHLRAIADLYGTSVQALCELNGISQRSILRPGQQLLVAASKPF